MDRGRSAVILHELSHVRKDCWAMVCCSPVEECKPTQTSSVQTGDVIEQLGVARRECLIDIRES